jgi:hypothetical protein
MLTAVDASFFSLKPRSQFSFFFALAAQLHMHRALSIPEILQIVCHHICPDPVRKPSEDATRDLARLARTCTTLSEPALDVLWSFQDTIIHILDTMPTDIWRKNRVSQYLPSM